MSIWLYKIILYFNDKFYYYKFSLFQRSPQISRFGLGPYIGYLLGSTFLDALRRVALRAMISPREKWADREGCYDL